MTRARSMVAAVPPRVWTAVAGLALLASLAVSAVIGAGLSVWRSAVGTAAQPPTATIEPPDSALVVLPGGRVTRAVAPPHHHVGPVAPVGPVVTGPVQGPVPLTVRPVSTTPSGPTATVTLVGFTPRGLPLGAGSHGNGSAEQDGTAEFEGHGQVTAHAAHLRHEARLHARAKHEARHAAGHRRATSGKHRARQAKAGHAAGKHRDNHRAED
jgi:hypothetical protein